MGYETRVCSACRREGHKLNAVIVKKAHGFHRLRYCICCGEDLNALRSKKLKRRNSSTLETQKSTIRRR